MRMQCKPVKYYIWDRNILINIFSTRSYSMCYYCGFFFGACQNVWGRLRIPFLFFAYSNRGCAIREKIILLIFSSNFSGWNSKIKFWFISSSHDFLYTYILFFQKTFRDILRTNSCAYLRKNEIRLRQISEPLFVQRQKKSV